MQKTQYQALDSNARGSWAEQFAERWLVNQGLLVHSKNFQRRGGELDLVLRDAANKRWVFVEVKYRKRNARVAAIECITARKQQRLRRTANLFLQSINDQSSEARIDVLIITPKAPSHVTNGPNYSHDGHRQQIVNGYHVLWIENAIDGER